MVKNLLLSLLAVFCLMTASAQTQTVKGLVIDETGTPIVGATVVVKDRPTIGTSTSVKGEFELSEVPPDGKTPDLLCGLQDPGCRCRSQYSGAA